MDAPPPVIGCAEQSREAGAAVEARPTQPVDGPVTGNESGARAVSDECVVFDGERQVGLRGCVGTGALRGNDVRLLVLQSPPDPRERGAPSPGACNTSRWTSAVAIVLTRPEIPMATRIVRTSPISACSASNTVRSNHQGGLGRRHRGPTSAPCRGGASGESCHFGTTTSRLGSAAECQSFLRLLYWCAPDPEFAGPLAVAALSFLCQTDLPRGDQGDGAWVRVDSITFALSPMRMTSSMVPLSRR